MLLFSYNLFSAEYSTVASCVRRRLARKQLKALRAEARSVSKFKEISYRLENKVVELTQTLQTRTEEKKWTSKHEEADTKAKSFQTALSTAEAELSRRDELLLAKADVEKRLDEAITKAAEKEAMIQKLSDELVAQAEKLQFQEKAFTHAPLTFRRGWNEVSSLREQLNRANAYNALTRNARVEAPVSPTFAPALRMPDSGGLSNGAALVPSSSNRHQRRHSFAGVVQLSPAEIRMSVDELMLDVKKNQALNHRAVSVAYNGEDNVLRMRNNGLADVRSYDDLAEEKIKLMQETKRLG
ncbi:hypothetical protein P692DRAFT_20910423 [Suillus brevipes Sb2]|nr:hypothetical protein P692DRAFT_20910423 [Suillus brevipes Sb2]